MPIATESLAPALPWASGEPAARPLRVAEVVTGLVLGGVGQVMVAIARHLDRSRFHVDFYCVVERGVLADDLERLGCRVTVLPAYDYRRLLQVRPGEMLRLRRLLRQERYDVVHTHLFGADLVGGLAARMAGVRGVVKTLHNMGRTKTRWQRAADRVLGRWTQRVICVSEHQRRDALARQGVPAERVLLVPNGVDVERFACPGREEHLRALGLSGRPVVGTVGRLIEEKGHIHLLQAVPLILQRHPDAAFLIVGDGQLRPRLEAFLKDKPYRDRVCITGLRQDIPELLALMDVFVFPSLSEGFPIALIEAMAARRPVAGSAIPQLDGVLVEGETGLAVPPGEPRALAGAVCRLLEDGTLRERVTRRAFELVSGAYSEAQMVRTLERVYASVAREAANGAGRQGRRGR